MPKDPPYYYLLTTSTTIILISIVTNNTTKQYFSIILSSGFMHQRHLSWFEGSKGAQGTTFVFVAPFVDACIKGTYIYDSCWFVRCFVLDLSCSSFELYNVLESITIYAIVGQFYYHNDTTLVGFSGPSFSHVKKLKNSSTRPRLKRSPNQVIIWVNLLE